MSSVPRTECQHTDSPRETAEPDNEPCESCRGRGWKHVTSRLAIVHEVIDDTADVSDKQPCGPCSGTGRAASSACRLAEGMRAMAMWSTNSKRGLIPGTIGITITVTEYNAGTKTYHAVSSTAFRPADVPLPATAYRRLESAPVSLVRPFVLAALTERKPYPNARHRYSTGDGDER